jgi:hypothetical protein
MRSPEQEAIWQATRERIAALEHEQWMRWAKNIVPELRTLTEGHYQSAFPLGGPRTPCVCKTCERIRRWERECFKPYSELSEEQKDYDRKEADAILADPNIMLKDSAQTALLWGFDIGASVNKNVVARAKAAGFSKVVPKA